MNEQLLTRLAESLEGINRSLQTSPKSWTRSEIQWNF